MVPDPSTITKMCDVPDQKSCGFACSSEQKKLIHVQCAISIIRNVYQIQNKKPKTLKH